MWILGLHYQIWSLSVFLRLQNLMVLFLSGQVSLRVLPYLPLGYEPPRP